MSEGYRPPHILRISVFCDAFPGTIDCTMSCNAVNITHGVLLYALKTPTHT